MSVLVVGGTGIDTVVPVAGLPVLAADATRPTGPIHDDVSHTGTCVALALRALGVPVALVDAIGDDDAGRRVAAAFAGWGIPLHTAVSPGGTRRAVNLMSPDGRRLSIYDGRTVPGYRLPPALYAPLLAAATHVHLTIVDFARHLLPDLRAAGVTVSTDLHDWDGTDPHHLDFALGADLVFVSAVQLADAGVRRILADGVASKVLVTDGANGATLHAREGSVRQPAADPGAPIADTNGAGDAFAAAFLAAWLAGSGDEVSLREAVVAGAYACTRPVGADCFIGRDELARRY
jgi:sugar/nucleoside kinase (ribokinase family)